MPDPPMKPPRLAWKTAGGDHGPYLFMVHGLLASHRQWLPNLAALRAHARPVLIDLWGHGKSPAPLADAPYEADAILEQIERVRIELGAARIVVCGHSFGAGLTLRYAFQYPRNVLGQVFTNSLSALSPPETFGTPAEREARAAAIEAGGRDTIRSMPFHPRNATRLDPAVRAELIAQADAVDPGGVARLMRVTGRRLCVLDDLPRVACPTLLVNGRWEKTFQALRDRALAGIPGCQVVDVEAGHAVSLENPRGFEAAVVSFLASLPDSPESARATGLD